MKEERITTLSELRLRESAPVAFVAGDSLRRKLESFGIQTGSLVTLLQKRPAVVFQCEQLQLAVEARVAQAIHVRANLAGSRR
jgi:Fe2+ transport system protein FeoA